MGRISNLTAVKIMAGLLPDAALTRALPHSTFFPFYHLISNESKAYIEPFYTIKTVTQFEKDLDSILKKYEPVSFVRAIQKEKTSRASVHFSFDDGLKEVYTTIAPILKKKGIPATFFVNTSFIDNKKLFHRFKNSLLAEQYDQCSNTQKKQVQKQFSGIKNVKLAILSLDYHQNKMRETLSEILNLDFEAFLKNESPYLTRDQLEELADDGFHIGAHSMDHPEFRVLKNDEILHQIKGSVLYLQEELNIDCRAFAFPYTDWGISTDLFLAIKNTFGTEFYTFGTAGIKKDSMDNHFQRLPIDAYKNEDALRIIRSELASYQLKRLLNKHIIHRS